MAGYFYAFADVAAAVAAGAMVTEDEQTVPAAEGTIVLREDGIAVVEAEIDPETGEVITPATLSLPLVILSPTMIEGCSDALIVPPGHAGFA